MTTSVQSLLVALLVVTGCTSMSADSRGAAQLAGLEKLHHVIVIYQENWSFDSLYGRFPGADGLANAGERIRQVKQDGRPYTTLPQPLDTSKQPPVPDPRFPANLPVAPYDAARYVPADQKTGDIEGISWAWYSEGWNDAVAGRPDALFQFHHQPFNYLAPYAEGTATRVEHLKDIEDLFAALRTGNVPAVAFVKPIGAHNEHPGYADLLRGQQYVATLVKAVQDSAVWKNSVIITYDEGAGRWDHVPPPRGDRWGPGVRVPAIIISPYAKRGFVDHTPYETVSILKLIETRWNLAPLGSRDAAANNLLNAFDFSLTPR